MVEERSQGSEALIATERPSFSSTTTSVGPPPILTSLGSLRIDPYTNLDTRRVHSTLKNALSPTSEMIDVHRGPASDGTGWSLEVCTLPLSCDPLKGPGCGTEFDYCNHSLFGVFRISRDSKTRCVLCAVYGRPAGFKLYPRPSPGQKTSSIHPTGQNLVYTEKSLAVWVMASLACCSESLGRTIHEQHPP